MHHKQNTKYQTQDIEPDIIDLRVFDIRQHVAYLLIR